MSRSLLLLLLFAFNKAGAQTSALATADSLFAVGNFHHAIEELQKTEPQSPAILMKLAQVQKASGNPVAALETYKTILKENPGRVLTAVAYAKLLSVTGRLKEADSLFNHLIKEYPTNAEFYYRLGLVREKLDDSTATGLFEITINHQKTHQQALIKVSKKALVDGKLKRAERLSKQGLEVNPKNSTLLSILAQTYYYQREYEFAVKEFEKLIDLGVGSEFIHSKLGTAYFHLGKYEKAIAHFNWALDYEDDNPATHYSLGKLYALKGEYENSEGHLLQSILLKAVTLDKEFTSLGLTYKLMGNPKEALSFFNKALAENPFNERAMYERAVAADSYFEDLRTRMSYYEAYLERFKDLGSPNLLLLARRRVKDIREEIHMRSSDSTQ